MNKHLNMFILTVFLIGQLVLSPLQTMTAYAQEPALDGENVLTVSEEQPTTEEQASTDTTSGEGEQASTTESVVVEQLEEQTTEAEAENNKPAAADGQTTSGLSPPVEDSDNEGLPEGPLEGSPEQGNETEGSSTESGEITTEENDGEEEKDPESEEAAEEGDESIAFKLTLDKLLLDNGNAIPETGLDPRKNFQVHYNWSLDEGHAYKGGDQVTFQLPKQLQVFQEIPGTLEGEYATFVLSTDGKVTFTFTEAVENSSKINGTFWFMSKFDLSNTVIEDGNVILDTFEDGGTLKVPINTGDMAAEVHKKGQANKNFAPTEINWTVTVDPKSIMHKNGVVTDTLPEGLTLKEDSVKVNGEAASVETTGQQFTVSLGNFSSPQTITYTTTIDEDAYDTTSFTNNATYKADGVTEVTKSDTVHVKRGAPLTKERGKYNPSDQTMEWTVNLNFNSKSMDEQTLTDSWQDASGVKLIGDVELYEVMLDDNGNVQSTGEKQVLKATSQQGNGFTVQIPAINTPHQIKYKTKLSNRVETINNKVSWGGVDQGNTGTAPIDAPTKEVTKTDYQKKVATWTITHNSIEAPIKDVTITDTLPDGLEFVGKENVTVTVGDKKIENPSVTIDNKTLTVKIDGDITGEIVVTFDTNFDFVAGGNKATLTNTANVNWIDEFRNPQKGKAEGNLKLNQETEDNGKKSGTYDPNTKKITWEVIVNYHQHDYKNLVVTDNPQGNQEIVANSVKVETVEVTSGGGITGGTELTDVKPEIDGNTLTVNIGKTNKPIRITYETTLENETAIEKEYTNEAQAKEGEEVVADLDATVTIPGGGEYVSKTGKHEGAVVDWAVVVNPQQAKMSNVVLTDTISNNQEFLKDSVKVYTTEPGQIVAKDEYNGKYKVNFSDDGQTLTVDFEEISQTYVVKYTTLHFAGHGEYVSNAYKVTGDNLNEDHVSGSEANVKIEQLAGGTSSGEVGYLKVKKVGSDKPEGLEGVTFELIDPVSKRVLKTGTTNDSGIIEFGRLKYGLYELKELNIPKGYLKPKDDELKVEVKQKYDKGDPSTIQIHTITNEKEIKQALIIKYDGTVPVQEPTPRSSGKFLPGAVFNIEDENGNVVQEGLVTDENGQILTEELEEGTYYLVETEAPEGYQLRTERQPFTIVAGNNAPVEVKFANYPHGSVNLKKVGKDFTNPTDELKPLQGVQFELQKKQADGTFEKVGETLITDVNGSIAVKDLVDGDYRFVEIATIEGYKMLSKDEQAKLTFTIENGELAKKTVAEKVVALFKESSDFTFTVENEVDDKTTKLVKHDAKDETKLLKGAQFKVYTKDDADAKPDPKTDTAVNDGQVYTTDDNGEIIINLEHGHYYYVETKAPSGYRIDRTPVEFEVKADTYVITKIGNKKRSGGGGGGGTPPPVDPTDPDPTDPTDPENPDPTDPTDPENPDPTDPTDPENPDPTDPTDPTTPTDPENPDPTDPTDPTTPTDPDENENPEDVTNNPNDPNSPKDPNEGEHGDGVTNNGGKHPNKPNTDGAGKLPQTGEELYVVMMFGGMALVLIGSVLVFRRRVS